MGSKWKFDESANYTVKKLSELWVLNAKIHIPTFYFKIWNIPLDKTLIEKCFYVSKSIDFNLPSILNHSFTCSSDSNCYETSISSKVLLKIKTINAKKYGRETMTNNSIPSWHDLKKIIRSYVLRDLSYF